MIDRDLYKIMSESLNLKIHKINEKTDMQNTKEWDSLNHVKIIMALSESSILKFKLQIMIS